MKKMMIKRSAFTLATILLVSSQTVLVNAETANTEEISLGGMSYYLSGHYETTESKEDGETLLLATPIVIPKNIAIAKVNDQLRVREKPGTNSAIIGTMPKDAYCIVEEVKDGWAKITSGKVKGYVSIQYLYMGEEGARKAKEVASLTATVTASNVNVRTEPSTLSRSNIITEVNRGEELDVISDSSLELLTKNDPNAAIWVKVVIDNSEGYVSREFVDIEYKWKTAVKLDPIDPSVSSIRQNIAAEAKKYIGLRYVWGGNSLVTGADCSGFVLAVYKACGVNWQSKGIPRSSAAMAASSKGRTVSLGNAKPGDLVFYGNSSGRVDHVALYIGNNQVVHESGWKSGCKISNVSYRKIIKIKNFLD